MKADFSGWATKAGLLCSDGRTIMPGAFEHQDKVKVPLVWQHGHSDPGNVLGHAILENRPEGVYAYGFFNKGVKAAEAKNLLEHDDINMMSIWANELVERSKKVMHGVIREVSLVLSGANPGALIENVTIRHSGGDEEVLDEEAIIYTGLELEHADAGDAGTGSSGDKETIEDVYNTLTDKQKSVVHFMLAEAAEGSGDATHSGTGEGNEGGEGEENEGGEGNEGEEGGEGEGDEGGEGDAGNGEGNNNGADGNLGHGNNQEGKNMGKRNVFDQSGQGKDTEPVLSHADIAGIVADATKGGSLKDAVEGYALEHGIDNIDILFPDAQTIGTTPEFFGRRTEWVDGILSGARKSPFSRIKTMSADLSFDDARAKGYIKGNLKKEEFFAVSRRITTPQTIYKKQKLDRDDIIDITDFDVVVWMKGEMRLMLDEELARAVLVGDGRDVDDDDKINETNIRPIATDDDLFTITVNVNIDDASSSVQEIIDAVVTSRSLYRGSGTPTLYTTELYIAKFLLLKDTLGRRLYTSLDQLATELRVAAVVPVEVMEDEAYADIVGIIVNMADYVIGADKGGAVAMFDDFDIDYNQYKYLIETRVSGALVKLKSAMVIRKRVSTDVLVSPVNAPTQAGANVTIVPTTHIAYTIGDFDGAVMYNSAPVAVGDTVTSSHPIVLPNDGYVTVKATAASGYYIDNSEDSEFSFDYHT